MRGIVYRVTATFRLPLSHIPPGRFLVARLAPRERPRESAQPNPSRLLVSRRERG
jgi:hypothetical protein